MWDGRLLGYAQRAVSQDMRPKANRVHFVRQRFKGHNQHFYRLI